MPVLVLVFPIDVDVDGVVTLRDKRVSYAACICLSAKELSLQSVDSLTSCTMASPEYPRSQSTINRSSAILTTFAQLLYGLIAILGPNER